MEPGAERSKGEVGSALVEAEWVGEGGRLPRRAIPSFAMVRDRWTRVVLGQ
jgi:hypothetical protein